ncbi:GNAT family N-acetyltransferase [Mycoplasma sp. P36-A1]|uniref:GNAT family N-acetyltransferase n=1 Tax=Mycoplasma sp. P36-A1 TaxID=3252900 RepID=UPI003C2C1BD0
MKYSLGIISIKKVGVGMREIKEMSLDRDLNDYVELAYNSYPSFKDNSFEGKEKFKELIRIRFNDPTSKYFGMFDDDVLIGAMRIITFEMNLFNVIVKAGGVASVAVDLMFKKQKVARELILFYEQYFNNLGIPIVSLLPFNPKFYKKMGYGLGTKLNQYKIKATDFPIDSNEADIRFITCKSQVDELLAFHDKVVKQTHGMFNRMVDEIYDIENNSDIKIVANYNEEDKIDGYFIYEFENGKDGNYTINNMFIKEFNYTNITAFEKLLGFIKKQDDQVNLVIINTLDDNFAYVFDNCLNDTNNYTDYGFLETNTQYIGPMYKILDVKHCFKLYNYRNYNNVNVNFKIIVVDESNNFTECIINLESGNIIVDASDYNVTIKMNIAYFSALFIGSTSVLGLYRLGLLEIDNLAYLNILDLAFYTPFKPRCNSDF